MESSVREFIEKCLTDEERCDLGLFDYESLSLETTIIRIVNSIEHIRTMKQVIENDFSFSDAPTPNQRNKEIMLDDFYNKVNSLMKVLNNDEMLDLIVKAIKDFDLNLTLKGM